ncbi:MAG TPA: ferritin-like domain-containing protein [Candidatus Baltobacteraceae bacterium]|nr:ferritin-like domain-containing protein [Candidatus Baltobacteraceae bacterium]
MTTQTPFLSDVQELRRRARENMMRGSVTSDYKGDLKQAVDILNQALATELVCVLRYKRHYYMSHGIYKDAVAQEFLQHANEEQGHADQIAERITQLGGEPDFNPEGLTSRSHSEYKAGGDMVDMIKENLVAERVAIESYREMVRFFGDNDPTTRRMLEGILAVEEEHANDMVDLLEQHER